MISISAQALGSPRSLSLEDDKVGWTESTEGGWVIGDRRAPMSVDALFETLTKNPPPAIPEEYTHSMEDIARGPIPWPLVIPQHILGEHLRSISSDVEDVLDQLGGYADVLAHSRRILSVLQPCRIDLAALRVEQGRSGSHVLDSFEPGPDSTCAPPIYSHATATGRLTVKEGPRILTLQKEHRRVLASRFDGGRVMQIDFVSLEPRVLRLLHAGVAPTDIYSDVSERIGGAVGRRQVKLATLKLLYGSSRAGIPEEIGNVGPSVLKQVEEYFGLPTLRAKLGSELRREGAIRSHWGRPLPEATENHLLVSHFTQSTAVDIALGGFGDLLEDIVSEDLDVVPCYVLHDALVVDVHPDSEPRLGVIVGRGIEVSGIGNFGISLSPAYIEMEVL